MSLLPELSGYNDLAVNRQHMPLSTPLSCWSSHTMGVRGIMQESLLPELESEFSGLEDSRSTAEAESASLKSELDASKDSFLRLSADFENFKKRSVSAPSFADVASRECFWCSW